MRNNIITYIAVFSLAFANAQLQQEDFSASTLPEGWSVKESASGHSWRFGYTGILKGSGYQNPASFESGGVVFEDYQYDGFENNVLELIGPEIDLVAKHIIDATIEVTYNLRSFANDGQFSVEVWDGKTWQNVLTESGNSEVKNSGKHKTSFINVSEYINKAFKVKFIYDDENTLTWGLGIDDYKLTGIVASEVAGLEHIGFVYFPNPVINNDLTLQSNKDIATVTMFNSIGQLVLYKKPNALESKLNLQQFAAGTYLVKVVIGNDEGHFKIIKK